MLTRTATAAAVAWAAVCPARADTLIEVREPTTLGGGGGGTIEPRLELQSPSSIFQSRRR